MTMSSPQKPLRFAVLIRVSTEKQEDQGESLRTQTTQTTEAVQRLEGTVTQTYSGAEHATPGYERKLLEEMLQDAQAKPRTFDAVMVADVSRWSRDNVRGETGLEVLRDAGVRFFVLGTEYNLFDPQARLFLSLSSSIGAYHAATQKQKSMLNKIERAKRGIPTGGKLPFGRTWDKKAEQWVVDPEKQAMIVDVAKRYLDGESLKELAIEYGVNHANLCKVLRERCGTEWELRFRAADLNIDETVPMTIPSLLDNETIEAVQRALTANRTYAKKPANSKYDYLLRGKVHCAECGTIFTGQMNEDNHKLYYRHRNKSIKASQCPYERKPWIPAQWLEEKVLEILLRTFGNVAQLEGAIKRATPQYDETTQSLRRVQQELTKLEEGKQRLLRLVVQGTIAEDDAAHQLEELKRREQLLRGQEARHTGDLGAAAIVEDPAWHCIAYWLNDVKNDQGDPLFMTEQTIDTLSPQDRKRLVEYAFGQPLPNGDPAGVYVRAPHPQRKDLSLEERYTIEIRGQVAYTLPIERRTLITPVDGEEGEEAVAPHASH